MLFIGWQNRCSWLTCLVFTLALGVTVHTLADEAKEHEFVQNVRSELNRRDWGSVRKLLADADSDQEKAMQIAILYPDLLATGDVELQRDVLVRLLRDNPNRNGEAILSQCVAIRHSKSHSVRMLSAAVIKKISIGENNADSIAEWLANASDTSVVLDLIEALKPWPDRIDNGISRNSMAVILLDNPKYLFAATLNPIVFANKEGSGGAGSSLLQPEFLPAAFAVRLGRKDVIPELVKRSERVGPLQMDLYRRCIAALDPHHKHGERLNEIQYEVRERWDYWSIKGVAKYDKSYRNGHFPAMLVGRVRKDDGSSPKVVQLRFVKRKNYEDDAFWFGYNSETGTFYLFCIVPARYAESSVADVGASIVAPIATSVVPVAIRADDGEEVLVNLRMSDILSEVNAK